MYVWSLYMRSDCDKAQIAVMKTIVKRCADLKANLAVIEVPEAEKCKFEKINFLSPFENDTWLAKRHTV